MTPAPMPNPFANMPGFNCFACGAHNQFGLKLQFFEHPDGVRSTFTPREEYKGFGDILHGGIQSTLLDEVMWWAAFSGKQLACLTQSMQIDFQGPIRVNQPLDVWAKITQEEPHRIHTKGSISIEGRTLGEAKGTYFFPSRKLIARTLGITVEKIPQELLNYTNP